jgi:hypothetical protein
MGKTTLMTKLMKYYWLKQFNKIYLFCPTYEKDDKWRDFDKNVSDGTIEVFGTVRNVTLKNLWARVDKQREKNQNYQALFYFDDCAGQEDFKIDRPNGLLNQLVSKGNWSGISTTWVVQKTTQASTIMRTNAEGVITFYMQSEKEKKYLFEEFGFGTYANFKNFLDSVCSQKYHSLYANRQGPGMADYYHNFKYCILNSKPA